jgi:hypothetical protein
VSVRVEPEKQSQWDKYIKRSMARNRICRVWLGKHEVHRYAVKKAGLKYSGMG